MKNNCIMLTPEQKLNFIANNSKLEGMECSEEEITRLKKVLNGEISVDQAIEEILEENLQEGKPLPDKTVAAWR